MNRNRKTLEVLALIIMSLFILYHILIIKSSSLSDLVGPKFFPLILFTVQVVMLIILIIKSKGNKLFILQMVDVKNSFFVIFLVLVYTHSLNVFGLLVSSILFILAYNFGTSKTVNRNIFFSSILFGIIIYLIFGLCLNITTT